MDALTAHVGLEAWIIEGVVQMADQRFYGNAVRHAE